MLSGRRCPCLFFRQEDASTELQGDRSASPSFEDFDDPWIAASSYLSDINIILLRVLSRHLGGEMKHATPHSVEFIRDLVCFAMIQSILR